MMFFCAPFVFIFLRRIILLMMDVVKEVLEKSGFSEMNPVQEAALSAGLLDGKSMVVAAPTASGKTLIAEMAAINAARNGKKTLYIVPLKALASEKYDDFNEKYNQLGLKTAISIGDLDSSDPWLSKYDVIIVTSEKLDSLLRHGISWLGQVGLVVADEIHLLNDPGRGPTLEITITKLRSLVKPQILGLSATIKNYKEIADWLGAKAVKSDYRPVKLYSGVCLEGKVSYHPEKDVLKLPQEEAESIELAEEALSQKKQALVFVSTRKYAESLSESLCPMVKKSLSATETTELKKIAEKILGAIERPTLQCEKLAGVVRFGAAFHHAGITAEQRKLVESGFRNGLIKVIAATPTLAAGINLPAYRVVIRDLKRFDSGYGMDYIPVLEIQQMSGRAGRPKYDKSGEAVLIAKKPGEAEYLWDNYIKGEPEKIASKLGVEPVLRMHTLALVASEMISSKQGLYDFFSKTFYSHQYKDDSKLHAHIDKMLDLLKSFRFIKGQGASPDNPFRRASSLSSTEERLEATPLGRRVSELYIDPLTADYIVRNLGKTAGSRISSFPILQMISNTIEMSPGLSIRKGDDEKLNELIALHEKELLDKPPNPWDIEYDDYVRSIKTAWLFTEWMNELGEDMILEGFGVTPGELRTRLNNADWLLYATQELGLLLKYMDLIKDVRKTRLRMKYGIREEILPLIRLKGVGRVRARMLFRNNLGSLSDLRKIPVETLGKIIGPKVAADVKSQLNQPMEDEQETIQ
jgi:helicase